MTVKRAIRATVKHDRETWYAKVGEPLTGRDGEGHRLTSRAVVVGILPENRILLTRGSYDWDPRAQVHGMTDIEWVDLETEDVEVAGLKAAEASRAANGWALYTTLELENDAEHVRALFIRPLDSATPPPAS